MDDLLNQLEELEEEIADFGCGFDTEDTLQEMEAHILELQFDASGKEKQLLGNIQDRIDKIRLLSDADLL